MSEAVPSPSDKRVAPITWKQLRWRTKAILLLFVTLFSLGGLEFLSRLYWARKGVAPVSRERVWRDFYPEISVSGIDRVAPHHGDDTFDVLVLGASVVSPAWGDIQQRLHAGLE